MRAAWIRDRRIANILAACRFVAPTRHAVCAPLPLFAQRYARYKNALPNAHRDVHGAPMSAAPNMSPTAPVPQP
jgi:hypothetical protein